MKTFHQILNFSGSKKAPKTRGGFWASADLLQDSPSYTVPSPPKDRSHSGVEHKTGRIPSAQKVVLYIAIGSQLMRSQPIDRSRSAIQVGHLPHTPCIALRPFGFLLPRCNEGLNWQQRNPTVAPIALPSSGDRSINTLLPPPTQPHPSSGALPPA